MLEITQQQEGPTVRLLEPDVRVQFAGRLVVSARDIEFEATQRQVTIRATDDVIVKGEVVHLD